MTLSILRSFPWPRRPVWQAPALGRIVWRRLRKTPLVVIDPAYLTDSQKRDIGLLDGRGPLNRRPERDPSAGP